MVEARRRWAVAALAAGLALLLLEAACRLVLTSGLSRWLPYVGLMDGEEAYPLFRTNLADRYEKTGNYDTLGPRLSFLVYHRTRGWALKPGVKAMTVYKDEVLNTNSRGLRGAEEFDYARTGKRRAIFLGDSFTFGDGVSDDETFVDVLRRRMPEAELLNFGVSNYAHDQMLIYLEEEGVKYKPDLVVVGVVDADAMRNMQDYRWAAKPRFRRRGSELRLENSPVPFPREIVRAEFFRPKLLDVAREKYNDYYWGTDEFRSEMETLTETIWDGIVDRARAAGARAAFVYLPAFYNLLPGYYHEMADTRFLFPGEERLKVYAESRGALFFSATPAFLEYMRGGRRPKVNHWDGREHRVAAEALHGFLRGAWAAP